jgi:general secretion pathway protein G
MEMLVVVAIIVILAGGGTFYYLKYLDQAKESKAKTQVKAIETAVDAYYTTHGEYPANLIVLTQSDDGGRPALDQEALMTPWKGQYQYNPSGAHNQGHKPDIWADGPRGKQIGNWPGAN